MQSCNCEVVKVCIFNFQHKSVEADRHLPKKLRMYDSACCIDIIIMTPANIQHQQTFPHELNFIN